MFDTHAHLNFKRLSQNLEEVIASAHAAGVHGILIPGTDIPTSKRAIEIAYSHEHIYAAVGVHPHHVFEIMQKKLDIPTLLNELDTLVADKNVKAVGEIGLDRHVYTDTKYADYVIDDTFFELQRSLFILQLQKAVDAQKSIIIHSREAADDTLAVLSHYWEPDMAGRMVFHCCEPDNRLLTFAIEKHIYIGVDGDITYDDKKKEFIRTIPIEHLVLETDAPFLLPEPLKSQKKYPNVPANIPLIASCIADLLQINIDEVKRITTENAKQLFAI